MNSRKLGLSWNGSSLAAIDPQLMVLASIHHIGGSDAGTTNVATNQAAIALRSTPGVLDTMTRGAEATGGGRPNLVSMQIDKTVEMGRDNIQPTGLGFNDMKLPE